jgi:hypothetical protein
VSDFYFLLFLLLCGWTFLRIIIHPRLAYEYPYFLGCMFTIFLVPQVLSMKLNPGLAPPDAVSDTFLMCFLCLLAAIIGYYFGPSINLTKKFNVNLDEKKLLTIALAYTVFGYLFLVLINTHPDRNQKGNWSGVLTIYCMLCQVINIAFSIYAFLAISQRKWKYILLAIVAALPILQLIIFNGRREPTALFILTLALSFFFLRNVVPSRILIIGGLVFTMLIIPLIGTYRQKSEEDPLKALTSMDMKGDFVKYFEEGKNMEVTVAAQMIDATRFYGSYDFGSDYWNEMVFRYFPAQIFSRELKNSLMIGSRGQERFYREFVPLNGLTTTCAGDGFRHFGYLGCLFYFFLGGFFRNLWQMAATSNVLVKTFYIVCMVQALLTVSHGTVNFLPGVFHMFIFLAIIAAYAKARD